MEGIHTQKTNAFRLSKAVKRVKDIMSDNPEDIIKERFLESGMHIYRQNGQYYCVDVQDQCIFNMNDQGLDVKLLDRLYRKVSLARTPQFTRQTRVIGNGLRRAVTQQGGASDENREYEVGTQDDYDESDRRGISR